MVPFDVLPRHRNPRLNDADGCSTHTKRDAQSYRRAYRARAARRLHRDRGL